MKTTKEFNQDKYHSALEANRKLAACNQEALQFELTFSCATIVKDICAEEQKFLVRNRCKELRKEAILTFRRRIKFRLPFAGIIRRLSYSTRFQDKG